MLDVSVAEPKLQPACVVPGISQQMTAGVAQHVRVNVGQVAEIADTSLRRD